VLSQELPSSTSSTSRCLVLVLALAVPAAPVDLPVPPVLLVLPRVVLLGVVLALGHRAAEPVASLDILQGEWDPGSREEMEWVWLVLEACKGCKVPAWGRTEAREVSQARWGTGPTGTRGRETCLTG
jgi:hypothetical protein